MSAPSPPASADWPLTAALATELAQRALANIAREYPNYPQLLLERDADLVRPRVLHPLFFGCFDWHSAVHTHWLLLRLLRATRELPLRGAIEAAFDAAFTAAHVRAEADYLVARPSFERPYGIAWLALLCADATSTRWAGPLAPLAAAARANAQLWLAALHYPVRSGTHNQTAFALAVLHDAARDTADRELAAAVSDQALALYRADTNAPLHFEPSGEDFLSPTLMEADLLRRLLPQQEFAAWLGRFLPGIPQRADARWLPCGEVNDEADGKAVHLHGLNLSRAWNLANVAAALPPADPRVAALRAAAARHRDAGLRATLATRHYAGDHWLPSFAVYLLTGNHHAEFAFSRG